jgi:tRNA-binding EMAP/Myf-like protein
LPFLSSLSLYVEQVDLGDPEGPRTIVSGLVSFVPRDALVGRAVVAVCNLKARSMRGIKSDGMLLCASNADHTAVEPLDPPPGSVPGDRLGFETDGARPGEAPAPATPNQVAKKKIWEAVQPDLATTSDRVATWKGAAMVGPGGGLVTCATLGGGSVS